MKYDHAIEELVRSGLVSDFGFLTEKGRRLLRLLRDRDTVDAGDFVMSVSGLTR